MNYWFRKQALPHGACTKAAREAGVGLPLVTAVLRGTRHNRTVQRVLARLAKLPMATMWGTPKPRRQQKG